jgi:serine/threonine-protein kinase RsbW
VPDPTCDENICKCGGRGVFLMQRLCDQIQYKDNGRTVEMHFKI